MILFINFTVLFYLIFIFIYCNFSILIKWVVSDHTIKELVSLVQLRGIYAVSWDYNVMSRGTNSKKFENSLLWLILQLHKTIWLYEYWVWRLVERSEGRFTGFGQLLVIFLLVINFYFSKKLPHHWLIKYLVGIKLTTMTIINLIMFINKSFFYGELVCFKAP